MSRFDFFLSIAHWAILVWALIYFILSPTWVYRYLLLVILFLILAAGKYYLNFSRIPFLVLVLSAYAAILGEYFTLNLYSIIFQYDKVLHFLVPMALTLAFYEKLKREKVKKMTFELSLFAAVGLEAIWEIIEYFIDFILNERMQGVFDTFFHPMVPGLQDTIFDMGAGLLGGLAAGIVILISEEYIRQKKA
jgi:uncharacterized membrane protein YjdF